MRDDYVISLGESGVINVNGPRKLEKTTKKPTPRNAKDAKVGCSVPISLNPFYRK